jgi:DNA-binding transcriptional LysR family regulator
MDQITGLRVFVLAVGEGSLAAAARRLGLSPAMAGKHLNALEKQLSTRLLQRTTRQLNLTDAGRRYYERCKRMLDEFDDANREIGDRDSVLRGTLRVAAPVTFGAMQMGQSMARYLGEHPQVTVEVLLNDRYVDLLDAGIDVAIRIGQLSQPELTVRRLAVSRMIACASPAYLERHGVPTTPAELREHARLAFSGAISPGDWTFTDSNGVDQSVPDPSRLHVNNMQFLLSAALAGAGIAYGPSFVFGEHVARGDLIPVLTNYTTTSLPIHAVFPTARYMPRLVRAFVDRLAEDFAGIPPWERA